MFPLGRVSISRTEVDVDEGTGTSMLAQRRCFAVDDGLVTLS